MKNITISIIALSLTVAALSGKELSKDAEVAAFQKLEQLASKQMQTGVTSKSSLLKARILEARALFANGELSRDQWLAKEKKLNVELLQCQTHNVSENPHQNHIEKVFEFQDRLLSTRQLLKHNESSISKNNRARIDKSEKKENATLMVEVEHLDSFTTLGVEEGKTTRVELENVTFNKDKSLFVGYYQDGWEEMVSLHDAKTKKQLGRVSCGGGIPEFYRFSWDNKFLGAKTKNVGWFVWKIPSFEEVLILGDLDFTKLSAAEQDDAEQPATDPGSKLGVKEKTKSE